MTQEEIRTFLTEKKIFVKNKSKEIQLKLFELGFRWSDCPTQELKHLNKPFLFMDTLQKLSYGEHVDFFYKHNYEEIPVEDILNIKVEHLPKTWEEYCKNNPINNGEVAMTTGGNISSLIAGRVRLSYDDRYSLSNLSAAEAHRALIQIHQLRDCYRGSIDPSLYRYSIIRNLANNLIVIQDTTRFLSFPTKERANEFLNNFRDLIEEAGDLI